MSDKLDHTAGVPLNAQHAKAPSAQDGSVDQAPAGASAQAATQGKKPSSRRRALVAGAVVLLAVVVAVVGFRFFAQPESDMEPNVIVGTLEGYTDEEIQAMLAKKVEEGMISFSLNTSMYLDHPQAETSIKFENPPNNAKLTKLRIVRDDTGEQIYETGLLAPGSYVDAAKLDKELPSGSYVCTGYISSYRQDTKQYLGNAACALTITVA